MSIEQYTVADYLNAARRRWRPFALVFAGILGTALAFALALPDTYRSVAEMRIDLQGPDINLLEPLTLTTYADQYIRSLEQKVVTSNNLRTWIGETDVFDAALAERGEGEVISEIFDGIRIGMLTTAVLEPRSGREVDLITGFTTVYEARDPESARYIADKLAAAFLEEDRALRVQRAVTTSSILQEQIEAKRAEIVRLEEQIAAFKEQNGSSLPEMRSVNLSVLERTERDLEAVQTQIRTLQQDKIFRESQLEEIRRMSPSAERLLALEEEYLRTVALYGPNHPDVIRIQRQVAVLTNRDGTTEDSAEIQQLQVELEEARQKYTPAHPDIARLQRRIDSLRAQQAQSLPGSNPGVDMDPHYLQLHAQVNAIDTELAELRTRSSDLRRRYDEVQDRIARMPQVEREFLALSRDLQTQQLAFDDLRARLAQAQQTESFEAGERGARLEQIRAARTPSSPSGPPRLAIVLLGTFLGLSLAGITAVGAEAVDRTIRGARDIRTLLQMQPIVAIPVVENSVSRAQRRRKIIITFASVLVIAVAVVSLYSGGAPLIVG